MKCPQCGAWNKAFLPRCNVCGMPLDNNTQKQADWEEAMHKKKPSLKVMQYDTDDNNPEVPDEISSDAFDPEALDRAALTDEMEELRQRRAEGARRIQQMKAQAADVRRSIREAQIAEPVPEPYDAAPQRDADSIVIRRRQQQQQNRYTDAIREEEWSAAKTPDYQTSDSQGYFGDPGDQSYTYVDDADAPIYYDGYTPDAGDQGALTDKEYMPRRMQTRTTRKDAQDPIIDDRPKKSLVGRIIVIALIALVCSSAVIAGGYFAARQYVINQGIQVREDNETNIVVTETTVDGHPAHTLTIYGKENSTVYLKEMQSSYVIADGKVSITVPDYMWYDTESSTFAVEADSDTMDVTVTPFIRYSQEGDQYQLDPIVFSINVPLSPIRLLNPATIRADVGVSIFEVRINVEQGSTVIIDGTNVSTLIRGETGNVSKNVQVLPVGENTISISVKSKYCRENKMEVTLYREPQEIPLELDATVLVEWNYEPITNEQYDNATAEERATMNRPSISGTTLPGADISVEFPHCNLEVDKATGRFTFIPLFSDLGNNDVVIRASYPEKTDSVITHTVYYMPNADIYTRRAWDLDAQYTDLLNYISMRKGTIYMGVGTIERIISTTPQMAVMNIGSDSFEKLVMLENSSKTTWTVGTKYKIFGDAYGLYDTMPRLTVRYTYLVE